MGALLTFPKKMLQKDMISPAADFDLHGSNWDFAWVLILGVYMWVWDR